MRKVTVDLIARSSVPSSSKKRINLLRNFRGRSQYVGTWGGFLLEFVWVPKKKRAKEIEKKTFFLDENKIKKKKIKLN